MSLKFVDPRASESDDGSEEAPDIDVDDVISFLSFLTNIRTKIMILHQNLARKSFSRRKNQFCHVN